MELEVSARWLGSKCEEGFDAMCGTCANVLDEGAFCEACVSAKETEDFVTAQSDKLNKTEIDPVLGKHSEQKEAEQTGAQKGKDRLMLKLGFGGSPAFICFSLAIYVFPRLFEFDEEAVAAFEASQALEECRLVFEQIGHQLEDGEEPNLALQCAGSNVPNFVERGGNTVRESPGNPAEYCLRALYFSNNSHKVMLKG